MQFIIPKQQVNILTLTRRLGFRPLLSKDSEFNCIRPLSGLDYPRFHLFIKEDNQNWIFDLHLDQKKPSYSGSVAHSGEYDGELIEREIARIKSQLEFGSIM